MPGILHGALIGSFGRSQVSSPPSTGLWGWYDAQHAYTQTSGTPSTLITTDGTAIGSLIDRSGSGHHAYQTVAGKKPLYKTNILNGLAIARFAVGSTQFLQASGMPTFPASMYVVCNPSTWGELRGIIAVGGDGGSPPLLLNQHSSTPNVYVFSGAYGGNASAALGSWHLIGGRANSGQTSNSLILNGGSTITSSVSPSTAGTNTQIGANSLNAGYFDGDISECLFYSNVTHDFASGDGLTVRQYLSDKYGLALPI